MQSEFRFLAVIVLLVALNDVFTSACADQKPSVEKPTMVCNLIETCSHVSAEIKNLETKLENLIALVNRTHPLQPAPSRKSLSLLL